MIDPKEVSVIIQGPYYPSITDLAIERVRRVLPGAEIIFSTWSGTKYNSEHFDKYVESEDPGAEAVFDNPRILHAANRQIVSTCAGLRLVSRRYALKIRSDLYLINDNFLKKYHLFPSRESGFRILTERIIISTSFTPNPRREPKPFHPSDWFYFGLREDLLRIFEVPLCPEPQTSRYFETRVRPRPKMDSWIPALCRYTAEQYIWIAFLRKYIELNFEHCFDIGSGNIELSERIFANNVIMLEAHDIGYTSLKHKNLRKRFDLSLMYSHKEWFVLYARHCEGRNLRFWFDWEKIKRLALCVYHPKKVFRNIVAILNIRFDPFYCADRKQLRSEVND